MRNSPSVIFFLELTFRFLKRRRIYWLHEELFTFKGLRITTSLYIIIYKCGKIWLKQQRTFCAATSTLSRKRSHSKTKTGRFASGICFKASSFSVRLWLNSIIMTVGLQHTHKKIATDYRDNDTIRNATMEPQCTRSWGVQLHGVRGSKSTAF